MHALLAALPAAPLPAPETPSFLKAGAVVATFIFIVGLIIALKGAGITNKADKQKISESTRTAGNVGIGIVLIVVGLSGTAIAIIVALVGQYTTGA